MPQKGPANAMWGHRYGSGILVFYTINYGRWPQSNHQLKKKKEREGKWGLTNDEECNSFIQQQSVTRLKSPFLFVSFRRHSWKACADSLSFFSLLESKSNPSIYIIRGRGPAVNLSWGKYMLSQGKGALELWSLEGQTFLIRSLH